MKTIRIILLILIIIGIGLLCTQKFWVPGLVHKILQFQGVPTSEQILPATVLVSSGDKQKQIFCEETENYFVVSSSNTDSVGSNILIKYKTNTSQNFSCVYTIANGDFEIKNGEADYFYAITNKFLIIDRGTAPYPRGLIIYNLDTRKEVFTDKYFGIESIKGNQIEYWSQTDIKPTTTNCPKINEWKSQIGGGSIESRVVLDLLTLTKSDLGEYRCDPLH